MTHLSTRLQERVNSGRNAASPGCQIARLLPTSRSNRTRLALMGAALMLAATLANAQGEVFLHNIADGRGADGFVVDGSSDMAAGTVSGAGDVNGDGISDIIIGAQYNDFPNTNNGRAFVVFGKSSGTSIAITSPGGGNGGFPINAEASEDRLHWVSGAGDVNGDGLADLVVGARFADPPGLQNAGKVYVVFGKTNTSAVNLSALGTAGFVVNGEQAEAQTGMTVSCAGDVNGDGYSDIVFTAPFAVVDGLSDAGRTHVVFGKTDPTAVNVSAVNLGSGGFTIDGQIDDNNPFHCASAGDVNGDGLADISIAAGGADLPGMLGAGRVYIVFGKASTGVVKLSAVSAGTGGFSIDGQTTQSRLGQVSSAGDVNADGLGDLILGSRLFGGSDEGRGYVVFGKSSTAPVVLASVFAGTGGFGILAGGADLQLGNAVSSAGDVNGDGFSDILIGANQSDAFGLSNAGRSYLIFGKTNGSTVSLELFRDGSAGGGQGFIIWGRNDWEFAGAPLSAGGDINADGLADVTVGAEVSGKENNPALKGDGRSYVIFSPFTPPLTPTYRANVLAGNAVRWGIGTHRFGVDATIFPDSRAWVDFATGTGPGLLGSSSVVVTINRSKASLFGLPAAQTANVFWSFGTSNRNDSTSRVTFRYTDAEIAGITEANLRIYRAASAAGPWTLLANQVVTAGRNEVSADTSELSNRVFALTAGTPDGTVPTANIQFVGSASTVNQAPEWTVSFSEDIGSTFTETDITPQGSLAASASVLSLTQTGATTFGVRLATTVPTASGSLGFRIAAGSVGDLSQNPIAQTDSPLFNINEVVAGPLAGDVDKDGLVNVADITRLGNFIVNGTPLP